MSSGWPLNLRTARRQLNTRDDLYSKGWYHSFRMPDGRLIQGTQSIERLERRLSTMPIPQDLRGKRVLDIGAWDGWFSFQMEQRGAEVLAVDLVELENFRYIHRKLNSKVQYRIMDVFDITPDRVGRFDIVLCLGVIYHLKHPLLALERVCDLTTDMAIIESWVVDDVAAHTEYPWMEFYEADELGGQSDNWTGPTLECLEAFLRTAGFARHKFIEHTSDHRAVYAAYRRFDPPPANPTAPAPELQLVLHSQNNGINVSAHRDDYLSAWFVTPETAIARETVFPDIRGYGTRPIFVTPAGENRWQINFKVPPGIAPGWQAVRVRTAAGGLSNPVEIAVDVPEETAGLNVKGACDGVTWKANQVGVGTGSVAIWVNGLPRNADLNNLAIYIGPARLTPDYIAPLPDDKGYRQVNAKLPRTVEPGPGDLVLRFGGVESAPLPFTVTED